MRSKSIILLALALGCGLVASIGISQVMDRRNQNNTNPGETQAIFVALHDINANDPLTPENVKIEEWPKSKIPHGAVTKLEELENKRARQKIFADEPVLTGKVIDANEVKSASTKIPKGYRVVAVRVDAVSGGGSLILPGDRVDVLVFLNKNPAVGVMETKSQTILQDIKVFAVDTTFTRTPDQEEPAMAAKTISLLVTPEQAEKVTLATEMGSIRLILRHDQDDTVMQSDGTNSSDVLGSEGANRKAEQPRAETGAQAAAMVNGAAHAAKSLIDLIHQQREATGKAAMANAAAPWKMMVYKGAEIEEMEIKGDGVPVVIDEAGAEVNTQSNPSSDVNATSGGDEPASSGDNTSTQLQAGPENPLDE
jgi:pilus assembly protein CpaB